MRRSLSILMAALALSGCESIIQSNPQNCVRNPDACGRDEFCNSTTALCEPLDCTVNLNLCDSTQYCDALSKRCTPKNCTIDSAMCTATQLCDPASKQCLTRTFVLGQPDPASDLNVAFGMNTPLSVQLVSDASGGSNTRLIVSDSSNHRVLIWNSVPTQNRPADSVIGMPNVHTQIAASSYGASVESNVSQPSSAWSDGARLFLSDFGSHRLLFFNMLPSGLAADGYPFSASGFWGQSDVSQTSANAPSGRVNALGVNDPRIFLERAPGSGFYVSDFTNNRVLVFNGVPATPQTAPSFVLGQTAFTGSGTGSMAQNLGNPRGLYSDGAQLFVSEQRNNRLLRFSLPITQNAQPATDVYGQLTFGLTAANRGGAVGNDTLSAPGGLYLLPGPSDRLFVADISNHRVLRFTLPSPQADLVLGQADFSSNQANRGDAPTAATLSSPVEVSSDGTRLAVADSGNHRVLLWQSLPTQNGQSADVVLGQPDGISADPNNPPSRSGLQFRAPAHVTTDGIRFFVVDSGNHRVLIWNSMPRDGVTPPDVVLGQSDFAAGRSNAGLSAPTAATLFSPACISAANGQLAVADTGNNRVLIWAQIPTQNFAPADFVLGQPDFTKQTPVAPASGLNQPSGVLFSGAALFVADSGYNRVVLYQDPLRASATADLVLGQPSLAVTTANSGGVSAHSLAGPRGLHIDSGKLLVADSLNNRVLIWNSIPSTIAQPADVVVGQLDFISNTTRLDRSRVPGVAAVLVQQGRLYLLSQSQNRIAYWNQVPTSNGQRGDGVLGQADFLATLPDSPDVPPLERLSGAQGISAFADQLFIADTQNNRVVVRALPQ